MKSDRLSFYAGILFLFLLLAANRAQAGGTFQRTKDGKAIVWNPDQQPGDEAEWSGGADDRGYAKGEGTIIWYKLDRVISGTNIPTERGHSTVIATYTGIMVNGMFDGTVETIDSKGEKVHATFRKGRRKTDWTPGPASTPATKGKKAARKSEESTPREAAATPRATVPPLKSERVAAPETPAPVTTLGQENESARGLAAPPSSIHVPDPVERESVTPAPVSTPLPSPSSTPTPPPPSPAAPPSEAPPSSAAPHPANAADDAKAVAALDKQYQAAVKANDATRMDRILAEDFVLVNGRGKVSTKADLLKAAREKRTTYERQEEEEGSQKVRVWGDTAVVTALLNIKGTESGIPVDYQLWFSDTYVRVPGGGWRYVFGQASRPMLKAESAK
jgi:ketosteroid isomerase-like protein